MACWTYVPPMVPIALTVQPGARLLDISQRPRGCSVFASPYPTARTGLVTLDLDTNVSLGDVAGAWP